MIVVAVGEVQAKYHLPLQPQQKRRVHDVVVRYLFILLIFFSALVVVAVVK